LKEDIKPIEERLAVPVFGDQPGLKGVNNFVSTITRYDQHTSNHLYQDNTNPAPTTYSPVDQPIYMIYGKKQSNFGVDAKRD